MENNDKLKEFNITNATCYYFVDVTRIGAFHFYNILFVKKSNESNHNFLNECLYFINTLFR